jgi:hypothetical protein
VERVFYFMPFIVVFFWILPLVAVIWFLVKINSIDNTLREISHKLDRLQRNDNKES